MKKLSFGLLSGAITLCASPLLFAGTNPYFNPLTQSSAVAPPPDVGDESHVNEVNTPWQTPAGVSQTNLTSLQEVEADGTQSILRVPVNFLPTFASMFDMLAYDTTGDYLFIPHETPSGAGLSRYDIAADRSEVLFRGDQGGNWPFGVCTIDPAAPDDFGDCPAWDADFGAFDPARWTPNGTVILGEEWSGLGRVIEVLNPLGPAPADPVVTSLVEGVDYRVLTSIASVGHEGIAFSKKWSNRVIYYIDESNSGSIYMLVLENEGDYAGGGQTFVLSVDAFAGMGGLPSDDWDDSAAARFGLATWVPMTDANGNPLPGVTNPFVPSDFGSRSGRDSADDVGGTPYGRPEDVEVGSLPNGNEILYVATTSEHGVISIEMLPEKKAMVRQFASRDTDRNLGFPATTGTLDSPDNLAQDALGNIYIIEDQPNSGDIGGDVWFARDTNSDGVAESLDHFLSIQVAGSEATGMIFSPKDPTKFVVNVQHPDSTDIAFAPFGFGDAVWEMDIEGVVPPSCDNLNRYGSTYNWNSGQWMTTCSSAEDFRFIQQLERAGRPRPGNGRGGP
jgi:hypothetical protein